VLIRKTFRYRVYLSPEQDERARRWEGTLRFVWNLALEQRFLNLDHCECDVRYMTAFDQINGLTDLREETDWLADVPRNVMAQLLVELDKAWQRCFKKLARQPRWKKKGRSTIGLCEPHPKVWRLDGDVLRFPKLGNLRAVVHRPLEGTPKTCTLKRDVDQWFVMISCEVDVADPVPNTNPPVGVDVGVVNILACSDGSTLTNPKFLQAAKKRLARAQRVVARRKKGSRNQKKARDRVAKLHRKVRCQRSHILHVETTRIAKNHGRVFVEKLNVQAMTASASGTVEDPGTNVAQKSGLNRAILDSGWGQARWMLDYKTLWEGGSVGEVPAPGSSQTCSECGIRDPLSRVSRGWFCCTSCKHGEDADTNAAKVILQRGLAADAAVAGCGGYAIGRPVRQQLRVVRRGTRSAQGRGSNKAPAFRPG
jgi:putative transposase